MTKYKALQILENYQNWRRGAEITQPNPTKIGEALDYVIKFAKKR